MSTRTNGSERSSSSSSVSSGGAVRIAGSCGSSWNFESWKSSGSELRRSQRSTSPIRISWSPASTMRSSRQTSRARQSSRIGVPCSSTWCETAEKRGASRPTNERDRLDLVRAEHVDREAPGLLRGPAGARSVEAAHEHERRIERDARERVGGHAAVHVARAGGHDRDAGGVGGHHRAEDALVDHLRIAADCGTGRAILDAADAHASGPGGAASGSAARNAASSALGRPRAATPDRDDLAPHGGRADDRRGAEQAVGELACDGGVGEQRDAEAAAHHLLRRVDVVELHHAARHDARGAEEGARQLVVARAAVEEHQLLAAELLDAHLAVDRERMAGRGDEHELLLVERDRLDRRVSQGAHEADLRLAREHHLEHLLRAARCGRRARCSGSRGRAARARPAARRCSPRARRRARGGRASGRCRRARGGRRRPPRARGARGGAAPRPARSAPCPGACAGRAGCRARPRAAAGARSARAG